MTELFKISEIFRIPFRKFTCDSFQERVTPDLDRNKRVISRDNLMKHAETVINEVAHSRSLLEIKVRYPLSSHNLLPCSFDIQGDPSG